MPDSTQSGAQGSQTKSEPSAECDDVVAVQMRAKIGVFDRNTAWAAHNRTVGRAAKETLDAPWRQMAPAGALCGACDSIEVAGGQGYIS